MHFERANPSVVKSIPQRDFLGTWLRLYARSQTIPQIDELVPGRIPSGDVPEFG
ncbi:hypothetical protein ACVIHI_002060 [Bradyrhizobium sp. USDA 4524]|uniref:hypothetical protein n=1 Tax=unclassified Bradyrhizobium TaxID=2631580 RepID=UPI001CD1A526|nr:MULTISPECIES: hypothetical protein [unclassified Bradyrhizobium]MCA1395407.1 hypothetical protein [Bradyrhizobium sp. BRP56]MCP1845018.1 hypothetical protein [Bradyrhizobium sp. USDA 4538]MCP1905583.1 hypothetical protein [Bradyrhizobium sp. USDA 4537]MCP1988761.1 hypothetical protein [Bradyrhizobium sp. USDA 4539]